MLRRQLVPDAALAKLMANLHRPVPARGPLQDEIFRESLVGEEIFGLERVQRFADEPLGEPSRNELANQLRA
jgi:hypothetical protein